MSEPLERRLEDLYEKLRILRDKKDRLLGEAGKWAGKRDELHGDMRRLRLRAEELRRSRDGLNEDVKRFKALRLDSLKRRKEILDEIRELRKEKAKADAEKPRRSRSSIEAEIEKIEWRIQTESLTLEEEKRLIERVKILEAQLESYRRAESIKRRIAELRREAERLRAEAIDHRSRALEAAARSQKYHEEMLGIIKARRDLKARADEMHERYIRLREETRGIDAEIRETLDEIRSVRGGGGGGGEEKKRGGIGEEGIGEAEARGEA